MTNETETETEHQHPVSPQTPDPFAVFADLLALIGNEKAYKRRLTGLSNALAAIAKSQAKLDADKAKFEAHQAKAIAELKQREEMADRVWEHVLAGKSAQESSEARCKQLEARCEELEKENDRLVNPVAPDPDFDFAPMQGSTITKSPPSHLSRSAPQGDSFSADTSITRSVEERVST
jgi:hypothetical protein